MTEAAEATTETTERAEPTGKDAIYAKVVDMVKDATGKRISRAKGREIFDTCIEEIFALACADSTVRLNGGFGSFHVRDYQSGSRTLPSGQKVEFGERKKLRYEEGVVVKALVANGGNLEEAMKARGASSDGSGEEPAPKEKPTAAGEAEAELD